MTTIIAPVESHEDSAFQPNGTGLAPALQRPARSFGYVPALPYIRDYTIEHPDVAKQVGALRVADADAPASVDLRRHFSPVEDQQTIGSCTANAGVGIGRVLPAACLRQAPRRLALVRVQGH